jgi:hypothetical protein
VFPFNISTVFFFFPGFFIESVPSIVLSLILFLHRVLRIPMSCLRIASCESCLAFATYETIVFSQLQLARLAGRLPDPLLLIDHFFIDTIKEFMIFLNVKKNLHMDDFWLFLRFHVYFSL